MLLLSNMKTWGKKQADQGSLDWKMAAPAPLTSCHLVSSLSVFCSCLNGPLCNPVLPGSLTLLRSISQKTAAWKKLDWSRVNAFYPTAKYFYSSLRHRCRQSMETQSWRWGGGFTDMDFFYLTKGRWDLSLTAALERVMMLIHSECEPMTLTCTSYAQKAASASVELLPWLILKPKPSCNLPWRCFRQ